MSKYQSIKTEVLKKLESNLPEIQARFGIKTLGIFGSVSRGEDSPDSDVDVFYAFQENRGGLRDYAGVIEYLENLFNRRIDFVSIKWMRPEMRELIQNDMIYSVCNEEISA